jgi:mRNA (2'-O-methyladenosine-N6-)-methyltransferase
MFLKCDLSTYNLKSLNIKFDVILVEPPLEEYQRTFGVTNTKLWNWKQVSFLTFI